MSWFNRLMRTVKRSSPSAAAPLHQDGEDSSESMDEWVNSRLDALDQEIERSKSLLALLEVETISHKLVDELPADCKLSWRMLWTRVWWTLVKPLPSIRDQSLMRKAVLLQSEFTRRKEAEEVLANEEQEHEQAIKVILLSMDAFRHLLNGKSPQDVASSTMSLARIGDVSAEEVHAPFSHSEEEDLDEFDDFDDPEEEYLVLED